MLPHGWVFLGALLCLCRCPFSLADVAKLVCYYDASSFVREGPAQLSLNELEPALNFCNYLIYGYAGIDPESFKIKSLNPELSYNRQHYAHITALRQKHPHLRILLSVGGERDLNAEGLPASSKYLSLLELPDSRNSFKASASAELIKYGFDGLDLAWQFPQLKPKHQQGALKRAWSSFKGWFSSSSIDPKAEEHKEQFATFVRELRVELQRNGKQLTLSMLPHVDPELFIDIPAVLAFVDFVNLGTYDFQTPQRDPKQADLPAPLYAMYDRDATHNVQHQLQYWLNHTANAQQLNIGITSYGRAWQMSPNSGITGFPPIPATEGAAPAGKQTGQPGLLSWPEICDLLQHHLGQGKDTDGQHLRKVGDPTKRYGIYAYRAAGENGENGVWVGYEDPTTAAIKAGFVQAQGLGGVAFHDLSLDDFRGQCAGEKYPILRSIKYKL
ncbi:chitinase-like protein Idgf5 [Drosophila novamexicana]|uniref:chitinase-like protein Idgf5 n=1 Tax=Drosophila novamexicana TaxID=47314 RepID=UPI0011E597E7|nr:chitinase-like protein Idgf5 [Drosophila novamexicana]